MRARHVIALAIACLLAACGGSSTVPSAGVPASGGVSKQTSVVLRIVIPFKKGAASHRPDYVSPSTLSVVYVISQGGSTVAGGSGYANLTIANCPAGSLGNECSVNLPVQVTSTGSFTFDVATFDAAQSGSTSSAPCALPSTTGCAGHLLSQSNVSQTITFGALNALSIALGGVATSIEVAPAVPEYLQGDITALTLWGPGTQVLDVQAYDADHNLITGAGAPTVAVTSATPTQLTATAVGSSQPSEFDLNAVTSGSPALVTPGTVDLHVTVTPASGSGGSVLTATVPVTIKHSFIYTTAYTRNTYIFEDGNTTPTTTLTSTATLADTWGLAVDAGGNVYVSEYSSGNVVEYPSGSTSGTVVDTHINPVALAISPSGTIALGTDTTGSDVFTAPLGSLSSPTHQTATGTTIFGIAYDASNNLYVGNNVGSVIVFNSALTATATHTGICGAAGVNGIAVDASGDVYVSCLSSVVEYSPGFASTIRTIGGFQLAYGLAVDLAGNLYVDDTANNRIDVVPPGATTAASFIPVSFIGGLTSVVVVPASVQL